MPNEYLRAPIPVLMGGYEQNIYIFRSHFGSRLTYPIGFRAFGVSGASAVCHSTQLNLSLRAGDAVGSFVRSARLQWIF